MIGLGFSGLDFSWEAGVDGRFSVNGALAKLPKGESLIGVVL